MTSAGLIGERFRILKPLGSGGMGSVVLAEDTWRDGRRVALKLAPLADARACEALEREFLLLSSLVHPFLVGAGELGACSGTRQGWLSLEHADGPVLREALRGEGPAAIAACLGQLARGLDFLHARGWVHGDVKEDNAVVVGVAPDRAVRLLDFGLARRAGAPPAERGFSGTLTHAAPEVLAGTPADPRSDLYALGVTAFTLLAGRRPFEASDPLALAEAHRKAPAPALQPLAPSAPRAIAELVDALLAKDPSDRPRSAAAVAEALDRALPGSGAEPPEAARAWSRAPALAGRTAAEAEASELLARLRDTRRPGPRVLWLVGGAGQGKSRLLGSLAARVQLARGLVLRGEPSGEPFSLWAEPVQDAVRALGAASDVVQARAAVLRRIVPSLAAPGAEASEPPESLPRDEEHLRMADALHDVFAALAGRPVLVVLDGAESADEESARVTSLLARRLELERERGRPLPVALAVALRPAAAWEGGLAIGRRADLAPAGEAELAEILAAMLPGFAHAARLAAIMARAGVASGRAAESWVAALFERGLLRREARGFSCRVEDPAVAVPPPGEAEAMAATVASLSADARALLAVAAESPRALAPAWLARAAGLADERAEAALAALESRQLVRVAAAREGHRIEPAGDLVRDAARAAAPDAARWAGRLADDPAVRGALGPADLAALEERAGRREHAAALLETAALEARSRGDGPREAAAWSRRAALVDGAERREAWRRAALARLAGDQIDAAADAAARARDGMAPEELGPQLVIEARLARRRGDVPAAVAAFERAREAGALGAEDELEYARTLAVAHDPRAPSVIEGLRARIADDPPRRVALQLLRGSSLLRARRTREAAAVLEAAARDAGRSGLVLAQASCENNLGVVAIREGRLSAARRHLDQAARLRRRAGARAALAGTLSNLALVDMARARHLEAARHARAAAEIQQDVGDRRGELVATLNEATAAVNGEDVRGASRALGRVRDLQGAAPDERLRVLVLVVEAILAWQLGRTADAAPLARKALDAAASAGDDVLRANALAVLASTCPDESAAREAVAWLLAEGRSPTEADVAALVAAASRLSRSPACWLAASPPAVPQDDAAAAARAARAAVGILEATEHGAPDEAAARLALAEASLACGAPRTETADLVRRAGDPAARELPPSIRIRLHGARAWVSRRDRPERAEEDLLAAMEVLRRQARAVAAGERDAFLARPDRLLLRDALLQVRVERLEMSRRAGWFEPVAARAPAAGDRTSRSDVVARREAEAAKRRAARLAEILEISRGISALQPVDDLLARALQSAMRFMDADRGFIVLGRPGERLSFAASRDRQGRAVPRAEFAVSFSVLDEVVRTRESVLSSDARADERFVSKASVLALDLRSVLVAPLVARAEVVGAIYVDNLQQSGVFDEEDRELLGLLAAQAAVAVENATLHAARVEKERIEQELAVARGIQQSLLPRSLPLGGAFRLAAVMQPARELGGDWYDAVAGPDGSVTVTVGDVSGKGVGAALFMVMARTILRAEAEGRERLDDWLVAANREIEAQIDDDKFLTLVALRLGADGRSLRLALAGHEPPVVFRRATGTAESLEAGGLALGMLPSIEGRVEERRLGLERGDLVTCISDGVTECRSPGGEMYGRRRLEACVQAAGARGATGLLAAVLAELDAWRGQAERSDDVTVVVLEARGESDAKGEEA